MPGAFLTVNTRGLGNVVSSLNGKRARFQIETRREMHRITIAVHRDVLSKGMSGTKGSHPLFGVTGAQGNTLGVRTGHTRRSVVQRVFESPGAVIGVVGSPLRQMKLHEEGGTITGRQFLRIPTRFAQLGSGVDRWTGVSIRDIPGAFLLRSANKTRLWAVRMLGEDLQLLYLLVRSVRLRPRHVFRDSLRRMEPFIRASFRNVATRIAGA